MMFALSLPFEFEEPVWLWLCLLVPLLVVGSLRSLAGLDPVRRVLALAVRSVLVILIACCLADVQRVQRNKDLTVTFLMDRSHSVEGMQDEQEAFILGATAEIPVNDRTTMIDFARHAYLQQPPMKGGYQVPAGRLPPMSNTDRTDVASALRLAMALFPHDAAKRIVLMSDGNDNMGDVLTEARRARADRIPVDVVPLWYEHGNEVYFDRMIAPSHAEKGEQVPLRMVLTSHRPVSGTIAVYHNDRLVNLPPEAARVKLRAGSNTLFLKLPVHTTGAQIFKATFRPDNESMDTIARNNTASAFSFISGPSKVLLITSNLDDDRLLVEALRKESLLVDVRVASSLGDFSLLQMQSYSSIILANIPAATFTDDQQADLAMYVKDMGSGLIMMGGDEGFGAGGWIGSPVEAVMPVTFEIKHKKVIPRGALVLIMHSCEIPRGNYWGKEMAKKSVDTISSQDYLGVLAYSWSPGGVSWEVPLDLNTNKAAVKSRIDKMAIGDMPDFGSSMQMALDALTKGRGRDAAQKHVIILSDGDASLPSARLLGAYKDAKVSVSTIGIGWGAHVFENKMRPISKKTGGRHYSARNPRQLPQIFSKEAKVVRRPLIVEDPFEPQVAFAYSDLLVGFDPNQDRLPQLGGMVLTSPKPSPHVQVPLIRKTNDGDDPVLAHWQCELGKTVAFTSGYWPRWGEQWTQWSGFSKLWAQIVRWTLRQETPANFETYTKIEGNRGRFVIDALDKDASYLNYLQLRSRLITPDREAIPLKFVQTGPGHYEAEFDADKAGDFLANIQVMDGENFRGTIRTGVSVPFSPEYRDLRPNETLLRQIQEITGGRWLDMPGTESDAFSHDLPATKAKRPAWTWVLAWLLLPAFLLDVAVRRLASWLALSIAVEILLLAVLLFGLDLIHSSWLGVLGTFVLVELIGWTIRFRYIGPLFDFMTHGVTAMAQTGERSTVALDKLKGTRDRVRDGMDAESGDAGDVVGQAAALPKAAKKRRVDVGDAKAKEAVGDLGNALGGASATDGPVEKRRTPAGGDKSAEEEDATSRLLRARKRAKRKRDDDEN